MKSTIKNLKQAAAILSSFNLIGADRFRVSCGFVTPNGDAIASEHGYGVLRGNAENDFAKGKKFWAQLIQATAWEANLDNVERVDWLGIFFRRKGEYWKIKMTDLDAGLFDVLQTDAGKFVHLTEPESRRIRGVCDVSRLVKKLPSTRWEEREYDDMVGLLAYDPDIDGDDDA